MWQQGSDRRGVEVAAAGGGERGGGGGGRGGWDEQHAADNFINSLPTLKSRTYTISQLQGEKCSSHADVRRFTARGASFVTWNLFEIVILTG